MTTASAPVVSVVTVCRNAAATLGTCIASVLAQTWPHIEYIVIDGASTDATPAILARHRDGIATLVSESDRGIYDAMNKGIARATGEFIIFLNADDHFVGPEAVARAMTEIARAPRADVYYGSIEVRDGAARIRHDPPPAEGAAEEMVLGCLPHQATFARRAVFARTGPFDLRWRRHADYDWWLKVLADPTLRLQRIDALIASFALGGASSELAKGQPEVFAIQNAAPLYRTPDWDRRRVEMFQRAWLEARIALARVNEAAAAPGAQARRGMPDLVAAARRWAVRALPGPAVRAIRGVRRRLLPR